MLYARRDRSLLQAAITTMELIYVSIVRNVRVQTGGAALGLLTAIGQSLSMLAIFSIMYEIMGVGGGLIRGDRILFLMTGIFLFLQHNMAISAGQGAGQSNDPMMSHAPMNFLVDFFAKAFSLLYTQIIAMVVLYYANLIIMGGGEFHEPERLVLLVILSWSSGIGIGMLFRSIAPYFPAMTMISNFYRRFNMISSGKMITANMLYTTGQPTWIFSWNPLFHTIDQARDAAFLNYNANYTNLDYPLYLSIGLIFLGFMAETHFRLKRRGF